MRVAEAEAHVSKLQNRGLVPLLSHQRLTKMLPIK
jgi:hypothetical protein